MTDRELSGIYVRVKGPKKWENKDITDCTEEQIRTCMKGRKEEELINWIVTICRQFKEMGEILDVSKADT
jgi:hypothetical protein